MIWIFLVIILLPFITRRIGRHFENIKKEKMEMKDTFKNWED